MKLDNRLAVVLLGLVGHGTMNGVRLAFSLFALHEGAGPLAVGVVYAFFSLVPALFALQLGRLVDRVGAAVPMLFCLGAFTAALTTVAAWGRLEALYATAPVIGAAFILYNIGLNSLTGQLGSPAERTSNFGWLTVGFALGTLLGPLAAGAMIDRIGYRAAFAVQAVVPLAGAAMLAWRRAGLPSGRGEGKAAGGSLRDLLAAPGVAAVILATALFASTWDVFIFVLPIVGRAMGLTATAIGVTMAWFSAGTFLPRVALPVLSRRFDDWTLMAANFFVSALGFALLPAVHAAPLLMLLAFLIGSGLGFGTPISYSLSYAVSPPGRQGELSGARSMATAVCHVSVPLSIGALGTLVGIAPVLLAVAAGVGASGWFSLRQRAAFAARKAG
jgi:MFS family permease